MAANCGDDEDAVGHFQDTDVGGLVRPLTQASVPISQKGKWRQSEHPLLKPESSKVLRI